MRVVELHIKRAENFVRIITCGSRLTPPPPTPFHPFPNGHMNTPVCASTPHESTWQIAIPCRPQKPGQARNKQRIAGFQNPLQRKNDQRGGEMPVNTLHVFFFQSFNQLLWIKPTTNAKWSLRICLTTNKNCVLSASSSVVWRIMVPAIEWSFRIGCGLYQQ